MKLFGYEISFKKAVPGNVVQGLASLFNFFGPIRESFTGAWQQNVTIDGPATLLTNSAVYACVTGIATDVAKLRIKLTEDDGTGIYEEIRSGSPFLPVLRKPNHYQTRIKFIEQWMLSKLLAGNAYVLKERDNRGLVVAMYVLQPSRVMPLITETGDVYYQLMTDWLSGIPNSVTVPASEIIHDTMCSLWHPLIGVPPLYACALSATMGNKIQQNSVNLFGNASRPGGILTAPGRISDEAALRLKTAFETNFGGPNVGRLAVLGDGLKFEPMILTAESNQLIEQLKWTVDDVGRAYHYPTWKLGGPLPTYKEAPDAMTVRYYTDCLQSLIESLELCLDEGLGLPSNYGTEVDIDNLMRMDVASLYETNNKGVTGGWLAPNEARYRDNRGPVNGGDGPYLQQQNYSLEALAKRDAQADPFAPATPPPAPKPLAPAPGGEPAPPPTKRLDAEDLNSYLAEFSKELVAQP